MAIKIVCWDLGGIMIELDRRGAALKIARGSRRFSSDELCALFTPQVPPVEFWEIVNWFDEASDPNASDYDFYLRMADFFELDYKKINFIKFREIWRSLIYLLPETVDLAQRLVGVRQGIISNLNRIHQRMIFTIIPRELFDIAIFSCVEQVMKPDPLIYERARRTANVRFEEMLFIDDKKENLEAATKLGMNVFHFDPKLPVQMRVRRLESHMRQLGIQIQSH